MVQLLKTNTEIEDPKQKVKKQKLPDLKHRVNQRLKLRLKKEPGPSSIYSWFIKPLSLLNSGLKFEW